MSVKKKTSVRRSIEDEIAVPQSAAERRAAEAGLRALIAKFAPSHLRLINAVRRSLRKRLPTVYEVVYEYRDWFVISFSPNDHGYEGVFSIRASVEGVKFYFNHGKELADPEKLLKGAGNQTRWILLEGPTTLARPEVASLIDDAIARNTLPFELSGRGSVILR